MKKLLLFILAVPLLSLSCNKKNQTPEEYFSFYADGKYYNYPQGKTKGSLFAGPSDALGAWFFDDNLVVSTIYGFSLKDPTIPGEFRFNFSEKNLPSQDTIILGDNGNSVTIRSFLNYSDDYKMQPPLSGRIIFTENTTKKLTGTFEFDVINIYDKTTILHITQGKFSIIPLL